MEQVIIHNRVFKKYISAEEINKKVNELAHLLNQKYQHVDEPPLLLGILNGSFVLMADLIRQLKFQCTVQFIRIESYQGIQTTGVVKMESDVSYKWVEKHVIVIEDIVDTGHTLNRFIPVLESYSPKSIFVAALLYKEQAIEVPVKLDHFCFNIPKAFVLGYGLDYDGLGRNLPHLFQMAE
ncbi:MAG: hypoxanthine phosphoribosyltransferase [Saprospiraceae bacterium]